MVAIHANVRTFTDDMSYRDVIIIIPKGEETHKETHYRRTVDLKTFCCDPLQTE